jgi:prepilin-type N-terminal cleavage/methylation domain-containing protein
MMTMPNATSYLALPGMRRRQRTSRRGFSLLEVVLALALLVGAIAVTGELIRLGTLSAARARDMTQAQLICESKLAEIMAGIMLPEAVSYAEYELDPEWLYSVELASADVPGLVILRVTVVQNLDPIQRPAEFSLTRLIQDPGVELAPAHNIDTGTDSGASTSSTSTTGGTP